MKADINKSSPLTNKELFDIINERAVDVIDVTKQKLTRDQIRVSSSRINVLEYLNDTAGVNGWKNGQEVTLAKRLLESFDLTEFDILQIVNNTPSTLVDMCNTIEAYSERFGEEDIVTMLAYCQEALNGPAPPEQEEEAVQPIAESIPMS